MGEATWARRRSGPQAVLIHCRRTGWAEAGSSRLPRGGKEKGCGAWPGVCTASLGKCKPPGIGDPGFIRW